LLFSLFYYAKLLKKDKYKETKSFVEKQVESAIKETISIGEELSYEGTNSADFLCSKTMGIYVLQILSFLSVQKSDDINRR
jgi:hypothetical protein